ncbi:MAG: NUDIX hydrolase [Balneola sp.]|nr:NUDIX hydrolase [Balneola sp.]
MSSRSVNNRIRIRSCGVLIEDGRLLLVELLSPVTESWIWIPPGGEVNFGESLEEAVIREFQEETGLKVSIDQLLEVNEVIKPPIHAVEVYFVVNREGGKLALGMDPELAADAQILRNIGFFTKNEIREMEIAPEGLTDKLHALLD